MDGPTYGTLSQKASQLRDRRAMRATNLALEYKKLQEAEEVDPGKIRLDNGDFCLTLTFDLRP